MTNKTPNRPFPIRLTDQEIRKLDRLAQKRGTTKHDLLRQIVRALVGLPTSGDVIEAVRLQLEHDE